MSPHRKKIALEPTVENRSVTENYRAMRKYFTLYNQAPAEQKTTLWRRGIRAAQAIVLACQTHNSLDSRLLDNASLMLRRAWGARKIQPSGEPIFEVLEVI